MSRANFTVPIQQAASFDDLNIMLVTRCRARQSERASQHAEMIREFSPQGNSIAE